jgi:hypothetical protein
MYDMIANLKEKAVEKRTRARIVADVVAPIEMKL